MNSRAKEAPEIEMPYPVLEERALALIPRRLLRAERRDLNDLPVSRPGTVLVFRHGTRYVAFRETTHLTGAEDSVVEAAAVCLVDMRPRYFTVHFPLPSASPADDFTIRAGFRARVTSAERAAEEGPVSLTRYLTDYLAQDPRLSKLGSEHQVEDIATVRDLVVSRIEAYCEYNPIDLPGLAVSLESAGVLTPRELRRHMQGLRDEAWRQEFERLRAGGEDISIERFMKLVEGGPAALTAAGLATGQTSVNDAITHAREDEQGQQGRFAEAVRLLQVNGGLDYLDIDPTDLVQAYLEKLTGQAIPRSQRNGLPRANSGKQQALGAASDEEDDEAPDEADLDD